MTQDSQRSRVSPILVLTKGGFPGAFPPEMEEPFQSGAPLAPWERGPGRCDEGHRAVPWSTTDMLHQKKTTLEAQPLLTGTLSGLNSSPVMASTASATAAASAKLASQGSVTIPDQVAPWELSQLVDHIAAHADVLSLDCFDTLLLRKTNAPIDVFYDLQNSEAFRRHGISAKNRVQAEKKARSLEQARRGKGEVTLHKIYAAAYPELAPEELEALSEAELQAEIEACYMLAATAEVILQAARRGLQVIVVSDTYLTEAELRRLLKARLPGDVYDAIDRIFVSSAVGHSKTRGLFRYVLEDLKKKPERIVHVGDNLSADYIAARQAGIAGIQLRSEQPLVEEHLRLSASATALLAPETRASRSLSSVYHGFLSSRQQSDDPASVLGYLGMGPMLYGFARFIEAEIVRLEGEGRRVKPLFLMRDGYLPQRVFESLCPERGAVSVSISRFVSYAASFTDEAAIEDYLARSAGTDRVEDLMTQLLLPEKTRQLIRSRLKKASDHSMELVKQVKRPEVTASIIAASTAFRRRLYRYLDRVAELQEGDTLLLVDLGYEGTTQRCLKRVFETERGVHLYGCYLMAASVANWRADRRGALDPDFCDDRALGTLIPYAALIEDLCTERSGSVVDYDEEGVPIAGNKVIEEAQYELIQPVQQECVRFAREAKEYFDATGAPPSVDSLRLATLGSIGRLLFLPSRPEVEYLDGFRLDMGLGTEDTFALFDREQGSEDLAKRGFMLLERSLSSLRTNAPIELRHAGLALSMTLLAQGRFAFDLAHSDMTHRELSVSVLVVDGADGNVNQLRAQATYDGYHSLLVPIGDCAFDLGVMLGQSCELVQIHSVDLIPQAKLLRKDEAENSISLLGEVKWEGCSEVARGVYRTPSESFAFISARPHRDGSEAFVVRVVFRPLVARQSANDNAGSASA